MTVFQRQEWDKSSSLYSEILSFSFAAWNKSGKWGRQFFTSLVSLGLLLIWCGELSRLFLIVCVWAVWSPPQSLPCHRPPFPSHLGTWVQALQGSSALETSPAASPQSTDSPPCQIWPSLIPPARGGRGRGGGRRKRRRVIWKKQVSENHWARGMNGLKQGGGGGERGDKLDLVKTLGDREASAQPWCTEQRYPAAPSYCGSMKQSHNPELVRLVSSISMQFKDQLINQKIWN